MFCYSEMGAWQITSRHRVDYRGLKPWLQASSIREQVATESGKACSLSGGRKSVWSGGKGSKAAGERSLGGITARALASLQKEQHSRKQISTELTHFATKLQGFSCFD
jgi:hypothetical protein